MSWFGDLMHEMMKPPQQRRDEYMARSKLAQRVAAEKAGRTQICPACGTVTIRRYGKQPHAVCPVCLSHWDGSPPDERQVIRTYRPTKMNMWGKFLSAEQRFRAEAALMSKAGWRVANQSQGSTHYQHTTGEVIATYERIPQSS